MLLLTEGQMNDHMGARLLVPMLPKSRELLADRGYGSDHFRAELAERGIAPCIPSIPSRKVPLSADGRYRRRVCLLEARRGPVHRRDQRGGFSFVLHPVVPEWHSDGSLSAINKPAGHALSECQHRQGGWRADAERHKRSVGNPKLFDMAYWSMRIP